jgi:hypothetical protein
MKRTLLLALALITVGCADPIPRNLDDLAQQGDGYFDRETMGPYSGPVFRFFPDDTTRVQLRANLKNGVRDGPYKVYYENGQLSQKLTYVAGELYGPDDRYHENGQLEGKGTYVAGKLDGAFERYYENGQWAIKGKFNMGHQCGEWIEDGETVTHNPCPPGPEDGN